MAAQRSLDALNGCHTR